MEASIPGVKNFFLTFRFCENGAGNLVVQWWSSTPHLILFL
jgi:hypothetical protein